MINIRLRVKNLMRRHGTSNLYQIAKDLNICVIFRQTPRGVNGFWRRVLRRKYICINKNLSEWQKAAVLGHELAHILFHPRYINYCMAGRSFFADRRKEDEADLFATEFISHSGDLDKEYILDFLKNGYKHRR